MNFLALVLGLGLERLLTHLFHFRAFHWLDPLFDSAFIRLKVTQPNGAIATTIVIVALIVAPVGLLEAALQGRFMHIPQFLFAVFVLLFCLGPRDLGETVADFCSAAEQSDSEKERRSAAALLERDIDSAELADPEEAIYAQANNRIFSVVFWFVILGPTGAWLFRVLDLMQRRAVHFSQHSPAAENESRVIAAAVLLYRVMAWVPGRLLALGYVLAGSFDGASSARQELEITESTLFPGPTDQLLGAIGCGAAESDPRNDRIERARSALGLVERTLYIWCFILALMTLYDLLS